MHALTTAFTDFQLLRSILFGLAGVGLLTLGLWLWYAAWSFSERWRFRYLRSDVRKLRSEIQEGQVGAAARDQLADLAGPLIQLGVLEQEPLPGPSNIPHLRTALAALDNCMRRWALDEARNTNWKSDYLPEENT